MAELGFFGLLFWLMVGHAICDFPLQTEWMVKSKVSTTRQPRSTSARPDLIWLHVLSGHAMIHAGAVAFITGSITLGLAEFVAHWLTDFGKGKRWYGFHTDQLLHVAAKLAWAFCVIQGLV